MSFWFDHSHSFEYSWWVVLAYVSALFLLLFPCCCPWSPLSKLTSSCVAHFADRQIITYGHLQSSMVYDLFANFHFIVDIKLHAIAAHFNIFWGWSSWWCPPDRGIRYRLFGIDSWTLPTEYPIFIAQAPECTLPSLLVVHTNAHQCHLTNRDDMTWYEYNDSWLMILH